MARAFSPDDFLWTTTWGVAPGWDSGGPLALGFQTSMREGAWTSAFARLVSGIVRAYGSNAKNTMSDGPTEKRLPRGKALARTGSPQGHQPVYDEAALNRFAERGAVAWADVPDAVKWVRETRGAADEE